jgi:hypothetical protein
MAYFVLLACFFAIEKLLLFIYRNKADKGSKIANWILLNYWEGFGFAIPFIWFCIKLNYEIRVLDVLVVFAMSIYYGLIKPGVFRKGALIFW